MDKWTDYLIRKTRRKSDWARARADNHIIISFQTTKMRDKHKADTVYNDELCIILPDSDRLMRDLFFINRLKNTYRMKPVQPSRMR